MRAFYEELRADEEIRSYVAAGNEVLGAIGYTEHGFAHAARTAETAAFVLTEIGSDEREIELARVAGYLHDIGNMVNRDQHALTSANLAFFLLKERGMAPADVAAVVSAVGNHDESNGKPVGRVSAALILADKSDVRRSRVRAPLGADSDIHDRVNYAARSSSLHVSRDSARILLALDIDTSYCSVMDYFEIFLGRMLMCRRAAEFLERSFSLSINGNKLL